MNPMTYEPSYLENSWILSNKAQSLGTTAFVDIESQNGAAARYMAAVTDGSVKIYCVNPWYGEQSFQKFLSNVTAEGSAEKIVPIRMTSDEAGAALNAVAEFIYIDSDKPDLGDRILGWAMHLTDNGVMGGNNWERPSVELAVVSAAVELNLSISIEQNYWFLTRH